MSEPTIIIGISKTETGYVVFDQFQREHHAYDERTMGMIIAHLLADGPKAEKVAPGVEKVRRAAVEIAGSLMPPRYAAATEPLVDALGTLARFVVRKAREPKATKPPKTRAPTPSRRRKMPAQETP